MEEINFIKWLGHASFYFIDKYGNRIFYIDPFDIKNTSLEKADIVFITHAHPDHFSLKDIEGILKEETTIVAPSGILDNMNLDWERKASVLPNKRYEVNGFQFKTVPAYNNHPLKLMFHPKENNWVGYIFEINAKKIYHAGDTDYIDEMNDLKDLNLDVAMLPIGGNYTMDEEEAARAANAIRAKYTIPMHYKNLVGDKYKEVEENFKKLVTKSKVLILDELR